MTSYINNLETRHIELHFLKFEYMALQEKQKSNLNSAYTWNKTAKAWVSRSTNNHWRAIEVAKQLGFTEEVKKGERLSYAEQLEIKKEKAEARAERYEQYSENAERRAENLQADFNKYRKDWSWLTQPIITGHAGSQAFARHRNKVMARYEKGFEEYQKSEYYQERSTTARATADNVKLKDKVYLHNKIKECNKILKMYQEHIVRYEDALYKIQQGGILKNRSGEPLTEDYIEQCIADRLEKYEWEHDKLEFFENCLEELGGIQFSKDNIKVGYIVNMKHWGRCEILSVGPMNVKYKILTGGAAGLGGTEPYAAIVEIIEEKEVKESKQKIENPYKIGDILCKHRPANSSIYRAYQVINTTATGVKLQEIAVENDIPVSYRFISDKQMQKKVVKSSYSDFIGVYMDDWALYKYSEPLVTGAV